ncbi:MAG: sulfotransferase domain-containing protein [Phycisphaeraceae bacterium]
MDQPHFLIIGAARSGTTALYESLCQHPGIFMTEPKEPHYFAFAGETPAFRGPGDDQMINRVAVTDPTAYRRLFDSAGQAQVAGEGSVSYLYYPQAARRVADECPRVRLLCLLRHPAERAFSAYLYMRSRLYEPLEDFRDALAAEEQRIAEGWHHIWHYRRMGYYHQQLQPWFEHFSPDQLRVHLFDDLREDADGLLRDCFDFLGVDPDFVPENRPSSVVSGVPRSRALGKILTRDLAIKRLVRPLVPPVLRHQLWRRLARANMNKPRLDEAVRAELTEGYREDILRLQDLIGRDLSSWLAERAAPRPTGA